MIDLDDIRREAREWLSAAERLPGGAVHPVALLANMALDLAWQHETTLAQLRTQAATSHWLIGEVNRLREGLLQAGLAEPREAPAMDMRIKATLTGVSP